MNNVSALNPSNKRNNYLDVVKAFSIILVVVGHCIQYGSGDLFLREELFFDNIVYKIIYSFHMPLFMLVSGYLFAFSLRRKTWTSVLAGRVKNLVIPIACWSVFSSAVDALVKVYYHEPITVLSVLKEYLRSFPTAFWFLWAVFWCSMVTVFIHHFLKDSPLVYGIIWLSMFFFTDSHNLSLYKFMYPFFVAGYFFNRKDVAHRLKKICVHPITWFSTGVVYAVLLLFFKRSSYIYTSGYTVLHKDILQQIGTDLYRMLIGFVGSVFILLTLYRLYAHIGEKTERAICYVGKNTMGIYIISVYISNYLLPYVFYDLSTVNYLYILLQTVFVTIICLLAMWVIQRIPIANRLFLGGR